MNPASILSQAMQHVPAMIVLAALLYGAYWLIGMTRWPNLSWRNNLLESVSFQAGKELGFRLSSLAMISLASLFLELLVVRWIASEIRVFAYFKSLALIACFLGFGLGCYLTKRKVCLLHTFAPLLAMVAIVELPWAPLRHLVVNLSGFIGWFSDVHIWSRAYFVGNAAWGIISASIAVGVIMALFGLIAITFVPFGQLVGTYLESSSKGILAYSLNVLASLVGIWIYTLLCFLSTPPVVWFAFLGVGLTLFFWRAARLRGALIGWFALTMLLFATGEYRTQWWGEESWKGSRADVYQLQPGKASIFWSPYQKLTVVPLLDNGEVVRYVLNTNDSWYQEVLSLSPDLVARHPHLNELSDVPLEFHQYNLPYRFFDHPPSVLIAGGGMGNDAASALRNGAGHVTAVEIDPLIYRKGKELHLEHPYSSDKVQVQVDDARAFIQRTKEKYDLVVYSILDSHTTTSSYTNIRLDNYVYTLESLRRTRELLKPDGVFVMSFSSERPWFAGRLREMVKIAFGKDPLTVLVGPEFFIVGNSDRVERTLAANPKLKQFIETRPNLAMTPAQPSTDDWPYLYQQYRGVPTVVWVLSLALILICWATFRRLKGSAKSNIQWHFFFLGAAFMLLEVQIISKAALLFGTTWLVNSIVISTMLAFILLANLVVSFAPNFPRLLAYVGLFGALAVSYLLPADRLFFDSMMVRGAVATALYCAPVFFAGLIFISSFREAGFNAEAFGSNLLGSLVGGLLESLSYLIGIKALVLIAAALYFVSLMTAKKGEVAEPEGSRALSAATS
jgi:SAM-dependent methyltransferase